MYNKKIVLAMMTTGGGHKSPAMAVQQALHKLYPEKFEVRLMDMVKEVGCEKLDKDIKDLWDFLLAHPLLCKTGFWAEEMFSLIVRIWRRIYFRPFFNALAHFIKEYQPDIIFSTHFFTSFAVCYVRRKLGINVKIINFDSDPFDIHLFWILKEVDHYIVCSEEVKSKLIRKGIPKEKLRVFPYPVRDGFFEMKFDNKNIRKKLSIDEEKKTLIISFGGQGVGGLDKFLDILLYENISLNVIIICGKNEKLKEYLDKKYFKGSKDVNLIVLGFVRDMNEVIYISDFAFIKPGAATTFEFMSMKKPLILYNSATISENGNIRFVLRNEIGLYCGNNAKRFLEAVKIISDNQRYQSFRNNYNKLNLRNGAKEIAKFVAEN